jgi:hypothetical protein
MIRENSKIDLAKSIQKRLLFFSFFFCFILIFTVLNSTTPFTDLKKKKLVLAETPNFVIHKDISAKKTNIQYFISLKFKNFHNSLKIIDSDLNFAKRSAIKSEVKKGDTILVVYHDKYLYISQLTKKDKNYLNPSKAFAESVKIERAIFWSSLFSIIICVFGYFFAKKEIKFIGWIALFTIILVIVIVFLLIDVSFVDPGKFSEF